LTAENLLKGVGVAPEVVVSCRRDGGGHDPDLSRPLAPPAPDLAYLTLNVRLRPTEDAAPGAGAENDIPEARWQDLEARWNAILGLEASIDTLRISMESLRNELESSSRRGLTPDEKVHAFNADVAQWSKAKNRIVYALPKLREFIHRSTWAVGTPERKKLEEVVKNHIRPRVPLPEMDRLVEQLESLLKDRQVLSAQGVAVQQECKSILGDVQGTLRTLQGNAAANAARKRGAANERSNKFR
jgi:hypothetical protein